MTKYYLAIDIGASSGRHMLGHMENGRMVLEEIHRFDNRQVHKDGHDCWDMEHLWKGVLEGIRKCGQLGKAPVTIGIDTWAVDYVLLDGAGRMIGDAVAYRDKRTDGMDAVVEGMISSQELYGRTGIQKQDFNTIYQLTALKRECPRHLEQAEGMLMIPDYLNYLLTGVKRQEYTNATSTGLVDAQECRWDYELIRRLGLPERLFGELSMPGTRVGELLPGIAEKVGFSSAVILPATHDTGSAFLAVPAREDTSVYLSSGTWSLLGVENEAPVTTEESRRQNFTNEGGAWYRYRFLKNIMGLWMIQSVRRELNGESYVAGRESRHASGRKWGFAELSGEDFDLTFGLMHTVEKSAEILVKVLSMRPDKLQTILPRNFRELAADLFLRHPGCEKACLQHLPIREPLKAVEEGFEAGNSFFIAETGA